jgi:hypothetical protein
LSAPAELQIPKRTQKYRILKITEQAPKNSLQEGTGFTGCGGTQVLCQGTTCMRKN